MKVFKDSEGMEWNVAVTVGSVKRVKSLTEVNLLSIVEKKEALAEIATDPILVCNVVYALCQPQAEQRGISDEKFGELLAGDSLDAATKALIEDLCDFFPKGRREVLRAAVEKMNQCQETTDGLLLAKLGSVDFDKLISRKAEQTATEAMKELNDLSTSSQG